MSKQLLIVDDAKTVRLYHRSILEPVGYGVDEATNGLEALELANIKHYDLYIVDINMPTLDGYGFLAKLRSSELDQVPVMMVSTEGEASDLRKAYQLGANLYLMKPVKPEVLLSFVQCMLGEKA